MEEQDRKTRERQSNLSKVDKVLGNVRVLLKRMIDFESTNLLANLRQCKAITWEEEDTIKVEYCTGLLVYTG